MLRTSIKLAPLVEPDYNIAVCKFNTHNICQMSTYNLINARLRNTAQRISQLYFDIKFLRHMPIIKLFLLLKHFRGSKSQLRQDLFVLSHTNFKTGGYFVEFGAASGYQLSNTFLMEQKFSWSGILAEPAKYWHNELYSKRPNSQIEELCVWSDSGSVLDFNETVDPELSTIKFFSSKNQSITKSQTVRSYTVKTISLIDLLRKHKAPKHIDYLSLDTEGSEFKILNSFDFNEYTFGVITCEHNYERDRIAIYDLLTKNGYIRKHEKISLFDDWYIQKK